MRSGRRCWTAIAGIVSLTPAGSAFLPRPRAGHHQQRQARQHRGLTGGEGRSRPAAAGLHGDRVLRCPAACRSQFRDRHPAVALDLFEMNSPAVEAALAAGDLDVGVLHPPIYTAGLESRELRSQRMLLALPEGHRLAENPVIAVRDLQGEPILMAPRSVGPTIAERIPRPCVGRAGAACRWDRARDRDQRDLRLAEVPRQNEHAGLSSLRRRAGEIACVAGMTGTTRQATGAATGGPLSRRHSPAGRRPASSFSETASCLRGRVRRRARSRHGRHGPSPSAR